MQPQTLAANFMRSEDALSLQPEPGLQREILASLPNLMVVRHHMRSGYVGAVHAHPQAQAVYVVSGRLRVTIAEQQIEAGPGDSFVVAGGVSHAATALTDAVLIDVFTPERQDYRPRNEP